MQGFNPTDVGPVAIGVLVTLLVMSILSIGIMVERAWAFRSAALGSRSVALEVSRLLKQGKREDAVAACERTPRAPLAQVLGAGLKEWRDQVAAEEDRDTAGAATREALQQAAALSLADMRRGLPALATIGSTAPFVGLFGTTFGIINAFEAIARVGAGSMGAISAGISEALVTTAFGLFVAVPAVWAYNAFLGRLERLSVELDRSSYQLVNHLSKQGR
jgi:biopolymer transport protein ExbB/biopolymer transport protein TolQ